MLISGFFLLLKTWCFTFVLIEFHSCSWIDTCALLDTSCCSPQKETLHSLSRRHRNCTERSLPTKTVCKLNGHLSTALWTLELTFRSRGTRMPALETQFGNFCWFMLFAWIYLACLFAFGFVWGFREFVWPVSKHLLSHIEVVNCWWLQLSCWWNRSMPVKPLHLFEDRIISCVWFTWRSLTSSVAFFVCPTKIWTHNMFVNWTKCSGLRINRSECIALLHQILRSPQICCMASLQETPNSKIQQKKSNARKGPTMAFCDFYSKARAKTFLR